MNKYKTIIFITALIIVLGIIITLTAGFNVKMITKEHMQVQLNIGKEFNSEDIKQIAEEIFAGQKVEIQKVEIYERQVLISTNEITDEQKSNLVTKINEKYETELNAEDITTDLIPKMELKEYITPHIFEMVLVTIIIAIYECIRYRKIGIVKVLVQTILSIAVSEMLVLSLLAISRIPVGSNLVPVIFVTYTVAILGLTITNENKLQKIKIDEANNNK
jgi:preprotein translocase subunit SecF